MRTLFTVAAFLTSSCCVAADRPNVVIVLMDDFGWGDPSCYGNKLVETKNIDRMAREGVRFTRGYSASPICSPSRCGIITGQFPARWRITSYLQTKAGNRACEMADFLDPQAPSLPRMLAEAGYATAHIGKWHLGGGRDVVEPPKFAAYGYRLGLGTYESPEPTAALGLKSTPWGKELEPQQVARHRRTHWMVDRTLDFFKDSPDKPKFVNLWLDDTHTPFAPSEEQMAVVRKAGDADQMTRYKGVLHNADLQIGRLLEGLKGTNTIVIFLGDNGASPPFERRRVGGLRGQKLSLYEGGIRVPFIVWNSKAPAANARTNGSIVATVDLVPTIASICGATLPDGYVSDGENIKEAFGGKEVKRARPLFWEYGRNDKSFAFPKDPKHRSPNLAMLEGDFKLLVNADGSGVELYDILADEKETRNVAVDRPEVAKRMTEAVLAWRKSMP